MNHGANRGESRPKYYAVEEITRLQRQRRRRQRRNRRIKATVILFLVAAISSIAFLKLRPDPAPPTVTQPATEQVQHSNSPSPEASASPTQRVQVRESTSPSSEPSASPTRRTQTHTAGALRMPGAKLVYHDSFVHGRKQASAQRYIMLHDTEGDSAPENIVSYWAGANKGAVAAHFVIGRDGRIVQCADIDVICHHAGWGGPGNADARFNVGANNGRGNGDDMVGTVPLRGYTSYGMNSYSIGIEMCHVGGQNYPKAQLQALDDVIAFIDTSLGKKLTIIDHKAWRHGNSDTDANFASYLANYKKYRSHR